MKNRITGNRAAIHLQYGLLFVFFLSLCVLLSTSRLSHASSLIIVNSTLDAKKGNDGLCTLREAIIAANQDKRSGGQAGECVAGSGSDTIILPAGTYLLTRTDSGNENASQTGDLDIAGDLSLVGEGTAVTLVDANALTDRVFQTLSGNISLSGLTIQQGHANHHGGGLHNNAHLTLTHVAIINNQASGAGGGLYQAGGSLTLSSVTIASNVANGGDGGGLYVNSGSASLANHQDKHDAQFCHNSW
jgi:CSLREA domain-containing protein